MNNGLLRITNEKEFVKGLPSFSLGAMTHPFVAAASDGITEQIRYVMKGQQETIFRGLTS